jgi:hypothetical protein
MGTMVRINEDNYEAIKKLAEVDGRSVTNMANRLLDKALNRDTEGKNTPLPKNYADKNLTDDLLKPTGISGEQYDSYEKKSEPTARGMGDVLAEIRELEAERDDALRFSQSIEYSKEIAESYDKQLSVLWEEYHLLKGE